MLHQRVKRKTKLRIQVEEEYINICADKIERMHLENMWESRKRKNKADYNHCCVSKSNSKNAIEK